MKIKKSWKPEVVSQGYLNWLAEKYKNINFKDHSLFGKDEIIAKRVLEIYKEDENNVENLFQAFLTLRHNLFGLEKDHEIFGLSCSLSRKLYERTGLNAFRYRNEKASEAFLDFYKTNYSFSSRAMYLIAATEKGYYKFDDYLSEANKLIDLFIKVVDETIEPEYRIHTLNLLNAMQGKRCGHYKKDKTSTSSIAYHRAIELYETNTDN